MANGWANFELQGVGDLAYPKRAILDSRETVREAKPGDASTYRIVTTVQFHVNCNSDSVASLSSDMDIFLQQDYMTAPIVNVGKTDGTVATKELISQNSAVWTIERVTETHNGDGTCVVSVVISDRTDF